MSTRKELRDYARHEFERYRNIDDLVCTSTFDRFDASSAPVCVVVWDVLLKCPR
jgi:hypothetical protein